ncbi:hypothetical protein GUJ93_ZPchr0004g38371 [Zizania palustris]|uniref:Uncharacterized protein n=1 Tax=Zizania palustris TaxID=103762 RepID=A0A8J5SGT3_ZIZPA|nr:hypothetical protein GUJ93_ZPchr0004g38371 [Zizania palustris]KAG8065549.1 hypothetical protein GUJ93_ZPchr0004g38371 [Zizania palustris]
MPPKTRRGAAAAARKGAGVRGRVVKAQAAVEESVPAEEAKEVPAGEVKATKEAPKVEEQRRQPSPSPPPQQPAAEEKSLSDAAANGMSHGEDEESQGTTKETYEEDKVNDWSLRMIQNMKRKLLWTTMRRIWSSMKSNMRMVMKLWNILKM